MTEISREAAEAQVDALFDYYDVDIEAEEPVDKEEKKYWRAVTQAKEKLTKYVEKGAVEINVGDDTCTVVQYLKNPISGAKGGAEKDRLEYHELNPMAKIAMSKAPDDDLLSQQYYLLGSLSKAGYKTILKLRIRDLKVAEILGTIFLVLYNH
jgi:hypothetical protein